METRYKRYYKLNRDKLRRKRKEYYYKNIERELERKRKDDEKNRERNLLRNKEYNKFHKEERNAYSRRYHQLNKDKINTRHSEYLQTEVGKMVNKAKHHNYRTLLGHMDLKVVQCVYEENIKRFGTLTCELCGDAIQFGDDSLDHFTPVTRNGGNERSNLGVAHKVCNSKKGSKTLEEYKLVLAAN